MSSFGFMRLRLVCGQLLSSYRCNKCMLIQNFNSIHRSGLKNSNLAIQVSKKELLNSKKSSDKDKLLFYYEKPKFFWILNGFGFLQFFFWVQISEFMYKSMKDVKLRGDGLNHAPVESFAWWQKLDFNDKTTRTLASAFCFFLGFGILATTWIYTLRAVRMLVLRKDGKTVSIVTYGPFGKDRVIDVPLDKISTNVSRAVAKTQLPIKVQDRWFYFMLDIKDGTFHNPELFDHTAGMKRVLKK